MINRIKNIFKHKHKWTIVKCSFPFPNGWATYCKGCEMLLDAGLDKETAKNIVKIMNKGDN